MGIEIISNDNLEPLMEMVSELWTDCIFDEELKKYRSIINSENETCYLIKDEGLYVAFIHLSIRNDYVEGATELPIAYVEGIYVKDNFRRQGIARQLMNAGTIWARKKGLRQMASDTDTGNSASINFHKTNGFYEVERIVCFIRDL